MPDYRRNFLPGGTYFFTVTLRDRTSNLLVAHIDALRDAVRRVRNERPFHIDACVVLPDHLHCLWTLPPGDSDYPSRWRDLKKSFSRAVDHPRIWQDRYWEHTIRDERDFAAHMDYIHFNPVRHGLVTHPADWPHSTFHKCAAAGLYPADWSLPQDETASYGEPNP